MNWMPIELVPMDRTPVLVWLESELLGSRVHAASFHPNVSIIGTVFAFDAPKPTHWMPQPVAPA